MIESSVRFVVNVEEEEEITFVERSGDRILTIISKSARGITLSP